MTWQQEEGAAEPVLRTAIRTAGYKADKPAIRDVHLSVAKGQLVGLIGPNGAGKSTTVKTILGLMEHVDGEVELGGRYRRYAYVPEQPIYYEYLTLWEHLRLAAASCGMEEEPFAARAEELLARFRMTEEKHHYPAHFSKGMKQKLMLIVAFLLEPDVYIVDEPFVGLDPRATSDFLALLRDELERGAGVLMSTHVLDAAERLCDRFALISGGSVVAKGTLDDIREAAGLAADAALNECFLALT